MKHVVIQAKSGWTSLNFSELREFKDLFVLLSLRDVKLRYKQTALGVMWVLIQPLITVAIFSVIFGKLAKMPSDGVPYMIFVFSGLLPWCMFSQGIQRASNSLISDARLISKVYFPRILVPISSVAAVIVDVLIMATALFVLMAFYQVTPTWKLAFLPFMLFVTFLFSCAMGIWLAAFNVYYRDFSYILPFVIQVWMYASPIVYSGNIVPAKWALVYSLNPLSGIIDAFRWCILGTIKFPIFSFSISCLLVLICFFGSCFTFRRIERFFADVI